MYKPRPLKGKAAPENNYNKNIIFILLFPLYPSPYRSPYSPFPFLKPPPFFPPFPSPFFFLPFFPFFFFLFLPFFFSLANIFTGQKRLTLIPLGIYKFRVRTRITSQRVLISSLTLLRPAIILIRPVLTLTPPTSLSRNGDGTTGPFPPDITPPTGPRVRLKIII